LHASGKSQDFNLLQECFSGIENTEIEYLASVFMTQFRLDLDKYYGTEVEFAIDKKHRQVKYYSPEAIFRGRIDLVYYDGTCLHIVDFKTGRTIDNSNLQGNLYGFAFSQGLSPAKIKVENWYIRQNAHIIRELNENDLLNTEELIHTIYNQIKDSTDEDFQATPNQHCSWCQFLHQCEKANQFIEKVPGNREEALEMALLYERYESRTKQLKSLLQGYVEQHGNLECEDGSSYTITDGGSREITNVKTFSDIVDQYQRKFKWVKSADHYVTDPKVNLTRAQRLIKEIPEIEALIEYKPRSGYLRRIKTAAQKQKPMEV
jgi:hypothetical protein